VAALCSILILGIWLYRHDLAYFVWWNALPGETYAFGFLYEHTPHGRLRELTALALDARSPRSASAQILLRKHGDADTLCVLIDGLPSDMVLDAMTLGTLIHMTWKQQWNPSPLPGGGELVQQSQRRSNVWKTWAQEACHTRRLAPGQ
jgi:hypothetical protein